MKRLALYLSLLVLFAGVAWLVLRGFSTVSRDPVEKLARNHLPAKYCQNPGCEPVPLPHTGP